MTRFYSWSELAGPQRSLITRCLEKWTALLDKQAPEREYQSYLEEHAGLFFGHPAETLFVISELELGSEYRIDFVVPKDRKSEGMAYELIELEIPGLEPHNLKGDPYQRFSHALQQTRDWRVWLADHPDSLNELFPSAGITATQSKFQYTIITGRRTDDKNLQRKRNEMAHISNMKVRSFEDLSDLIISRIFMDYPGIRSYQMDAIDKATRNELANPFFRAWSSKSWRKLCNIMSGPHAMANSANIIINNRSYSDILGEFRFQDQADE